VAAPATTAHFETNREVIAALGYDAVIERRDDRVIVTG